MHGLFPVQVTNDEQTITSARGSLDRQEADFLARVGPAGVFSLEQAERILGEGWANYVRRYIARLKSKGWIERIKPGLYAVIPLSSGTQRTPQLHEYLVAMRLVAPAAIAFFSAMNYHGLTEQLPREIYIATDHRVSGTRRASLGFTYRIISLPPARLFGLRTEWVNESPFEITDLEKTLLDGLMLPQYVGGVGTISQALAHSWPRFDEARLYDYAVRIGVSAVVKRLGFLLEALRVGNPETLRRSVELATGYPLLDPTLPAVGPHSRRWGLRVNVKVQP
jgi:predicted transcriptional regulator of viral defense system